MKKLYLVFLLTIGFALGTSAQSVLFSVISPFGTVYNGTDFSLSYTVGEPIVYGYEDADLSVGAGYEQGYSTIDFVDTLYGEKWEAQIFPNPANDYFRIKIKSTNGDDFLVRMHDMAGRQIQLDREVSQDVTFEGGRKVVAFYIPIQVRTGVYILTITNRTTNNSKNARLSVVSPNN